MKHRPIVEYILTITQLPIVLLQLLLALVALLLASADWLLTQLRLYLATAPPMDIKKIKPDKPSDDLPPWVVELLDHSPDIIAFIDALKANDDAKLREMREYVEATDIGRQVVDLHRRLYIIAKPNHTENFVRIRNVIEAIPAEALPDFLKDARIVFNRP